MVLLFPATRFNVFKGVLPGYIFRKFFWHFVGLCFKSYGGCQNSIQRVERKISRKFSPESFQFYNCFPNLGQNFLVGLSKMNSMCPVEHLGKLFQGIRVKKTPVFCQKLLGSVLKMHFTCTELFFRFFKTFSIVNAISKQVVRKQ